MDIEPTEDGIRGPGVYGSDLSPRAGEMYELIRTLYPICRSITGHGVRATLQTLQAKIPIAIHEVPSGTAVFDWTIPREWNINDAYIKNSSGVRVVDFKASNLHVMSYSVPVRATMRMDALRPHLFSLPEQPEWIPYRTSYYKDNWGFCLSHNQLSQMRDDEYEVCIDSHLGPGSLTYGECYIPGEVQEEVLVSCHVCHPSLCNDNLSGIAVAVALAQDLERATPHHSYRFLFIPGTIGSIAWLALNEHHLWKVKHGMVLTGVGDAGGLTYKRSRRGDAAVDRAVTHVLKHSGSPHSVIDFFPYGYDERQYCSPGFDLPVGCLMRTPHGEYSEYHTSADDLQFIRPSALLDTYEICRSVFRLLDRNRVYLNMNPKGEPQLGRRGLYRQVAGQQGSQSRELLLLWVLNLADGRHSLLDIAERAGVAFEDICQAAEALAACGLVQEHEPS